MRQRLFAAVRLRNQQIVQVHAQLFGVAGIQRVFGVNEGRQTAGFLRVGNDVEHERSFARGFRAINFHHPAARNAAHAQRQIHAQRAGGDDFDFDPRVFIAQSHDAAFTVGFGDR